MRTPHSTDDLRDELRLQARECQEWDLPAVAHPRRTPPRRAWAVLAVTAVLVAAVLVVPGLLGGPVRPIDLSGPPGPSADAPAGTAQVVDFDDLGGRCSSDTAAAGDGACWVPVTVEADGRVLEGRGQGAYGAAGSSATSVTLEPRDGDDLWVMVAGRDGGHPAVDVRAGGRPATEVPASATPTLLRLTPSGDAPVDVSARWTGGEPLVLRTFQPVASDPRADWLATLSACSEAALGCIAPETVRVDGLDLARTELGAEGAGDLRGRLARPQPGAWLMLGTSRPDGGGPLVVGVGGADAVPVPVRRPVLVRIPDGLPATYEVHTEDGRPLPLFMWLYEPTG